MVLGVVTGQQSLNGSCTLLDGIHALEVDILLVFLVMRLAMRTIRLVELLSFLGRIARGLFVLARPLVAHLEELQTREAVKLNVNNENNEKR